MLRVLLAEEGQVGAGQVEQLGDDGQHPVEVAGPGGAFEAPAHRAGGDPHLRVPARVDLVDGRGEHHVGARLFGDRHVRVEGARIPVEVLARPELQRVDEDGDDDLALGPGQFTGGPDQGGVALVQGAHGHHHGPPSGARQLVQLIGGVQQQLGH